VRLLSSKQVAAIHDEVLLTEKGLNVPYTMDKVDSIVGRIQQIIYYEQDASMDSFTLAALYAEAIVTGHPFPDANKRTAFITSMTVLSLSLEADYPNEFKDIISNFYETQKNRYPTELMVSLAKKEITHIELATTYRTTAYASLVGWGVFKIASMIVDYLKK